MLNDSLALAAQRLGRAGRITCLTGAGVSAESGVATFRDAQTGLWSQFDPQQLASQSGFAADPGLVWRWYAMRLAAVEAAAPNPGHWALARLERQASSFTLITQNVDDLHERAGSREVVHLHGSIAAFRCNRCRRAHQPTAAEREAAHPPRCAACGGPVRPDVVWFGELLPPRALDCAWQAASTCDVMLIVGTSGVVYPAAELPAVAKAAGALLINIDPEAGPMAALSDLFLQGPSGTILPLLLEEMEAI